MVVDSALKVQGRVIYALMMREVHTIHGNSRLGYLWTLINTMWGIFVFWGLRYAMGAGDPHGMSSLLFLTTGFGIYSIFSGTVSKCMTAVSGNKALLTFPQVTPVDIMAPVSVLPEDAIPWWPYFFYAKEDRPDTISCYGLMNMESNYTFFSRTDG